MSYLKIMNKYEKGEIEKKLKEQFGIESVPGLIIQRGEERLFLFQGDFTESEIKKLESSVVIERLGVYFARIVRDEIRLSIEGTQILKGQIKKNIFTLKDDQVEEWMTGADLQVATGEHGFLIIKHGSDFLGCGKASEHKISNFIPKSRRLKHRG